MYKLILRPIVFLLKSEQAHYFTMFCLKLFCKIPCFKGILSQLFQIKNKKLETHLFGLSFPNPVGLAAGFDKNGNWIDELSCLGFGFIEVGTVTPKAQPGNEAPRLFRLVEDEALINRMGFNNNGIEALIENLKKRNSNIIIGGNIGKNKITPNESAASDYLICFESLFPYIDYFVVNVSSPNTPGLRALQEKEPLMALLVQLQNKNKEKEKPKPILLKIAPDLTDSQLDDIVEIVETTKIAGIIATNTTIDRSDLTTKTKKLEEIGMGGLSGKPLGKKATEVIRYLSKKSNASFPIIGVGGIHNAEDAIEKLAAGASLIQIYTGLIYEGPILVKNINLEILKTK